MLLAFSAVAHASDDGYLQICIAAAADFTPIYPTVNVPGSFREVSAVFALPGGESHNVSGTWYAVDVGNAAPANYRIDASSLDNTSKGRLFVTLPRDFPVGKYRLDVEVDGKPWKSAAFNHGQRIQRRLTKRQPGYRGARRQRRARAACAEGGTARGHASDRARADVDL